MNNEMDLDERNFISFSSLLFPFHRDDQWKINQSFLLQSAQPLISFVESNIDDCFQIYWPTLIAMGILYIPIFLLSLFNHSISNLSKWFLTLPIVFYLLFIPTCLPVRAIPLFGTCVASIGIYYAQKVCEWILIRRHEFSQWSFFDIHHELLHYRVYTKAVGVKQLEKETKEIIFKGPIEYRKHCRTLCSMLSNIIKYYFLLDLFIYLNSAAFSTDFYWKYYQKYLCVRIIINQFSGCIIFLLFTLNYEFVRWFICMTCHRPVELMPDIFRQPYLAVSPSDFWSRWHHVYRHTWIELIFKPVTKCLLFYWPKAPKFLTQSVSSICVFFFSGVVHEYFVYVTFGQISGDQIIFFVIQGLAVIVECFIKYLLRDRYVPNSFGFIVTFLFNGLTAGYFIQPWISYFNRGQTLKYSLVDSIQRKFF